MEAVSRISLLQTKRLQKNDWLSEAEPVWTCNFPSIDSDSWGTGICQGRSPSRAGVIGTADKLVTVEDKFTSLAEHLLGRTLVADNIDTGIRLARKYRQSLRIVTLEGDLINPGGAMSGGAFKNSSNLLSRRREIEELEKTVARLKTELQKSETEVRPQRRSGRRCMQRWKRSSRNCRMTMWFKILRR